MPTTCFEEEAQVGAVFLLGDLCTINELNGTGWTVAIAAYSHIEKDFSNNFHFSRKGFPVSNNLLFSEGIWKMLVC